MNKLQIVGRLIAAIFVVGAAPLSADVTMPGIFGDHMVLQQDAKLPVWGTAQAGEKVTVSVGSSIGNTVADADGNWMVKLAPLPVGAAPLTMTVAGKNTLKFEDVLVGDVWVCSGQSNMGFSMADAHNATTELPQANDPQLRFYRVPSKVSLKPLTTVSGTWVLCTPETTKGFSAVGYFFGRELRTHLNRPIGLIGTYWGGTVAQAWTSLDALKKDPVLKHYVDAHDKIMAGYTPQAVAEFQPALAAYQAQRNKWETEVNLPFKDKLRAWNEAAMKAKADNQPLPPKPGPIPLAPKAVVAPDGGQNAPANLFNAMIAPLIPYAIKGAIWYQGEGNGGQPVEYRSLFGDMITDWRQHWGQGDFPFLFVQLAKFKAPNPNWAELRNSQLKTLELPNTGMATAIDIGDLNDIHPKDKIDVGQRLVLVARHVAYGENLVYSGPIFDKITVTGDKIRVSFTQLGGGLIIGSAPWAPPDAIPIPTTSLIGFTVAGTDNKWVPADAKIEGDSVVVSSPQVPQPVAARYAFESATGNLYNKEGLPAIPFRSDQGGEAQPPPAPVLPTAK